jgi:hypothetical protein
MQINVTVRHIMILRLLIHGFPKPVWNTPHHSTPLAPTAVDFGSGASAII